ncbi:MAG: PEP-utilizing enzyme [Candidatus Paceibacterota bacterium]
MSNFKNKNWIKIFSRDIGVYYGEMTLLAISNDKFLNKSVYSHMIVPDDNLQSYVVDKEEFSLVVKEVKGIIKTEGKYDDFKEKSLNKSEEFLNFSKNLEKDILDKLSDDKLFDLFLRFNNLWKDYSTLMSWIALILNNQASEEVKKIIKSKIDPKNENFDKYLTSALEPSDKSSILLLKEKVKNIPKENRKKLLKVFEEFKWFPCFDITDNPWKKEDFFEFVNNIERTEPKEKFSLEQIENNLNLSKQEKNRIKLAQDIIYLKDLRDDYRRKSMYFSIPLFREIAKRLSITRKELGLLTFNEIKSWLLDNKSVSKRTIKQRHNEFLVYQDEKSKNFVCIEGLEVVNFLKKINFSLEGNHEDKIKGTVANKSEKITKGIVKIISSKKDLNKIKKGNILVAVTTHPEYVTAMTKACAFITDEGGLTSHAAIVAREMNKPCIVGTGNATKVLKDGDEIEVDANNGVVKIINKNSEE